MAGWSKMEGIKLMRLNIIRHRQKIFKYLEDINDTKLKPKIIIDSLDMKCHKAENEHSSKLVTVKKELIEDDYDSENDFLSGTEYENENDEISVGSNEHCNDEITEEIGCTRTSKRIGLVKNKEECNIIIKVEDEKKLDEKPAFLTKKSESTITFQNYRMYRKAIHKTLHNAKERACRERIGKLFLNLGNICSFLECNRRIPSKRSILKAAKKECVLLKQLEIKLTKEKKNLNAANNVLKSKLEILSSVNSDKTC